MKIMRALLVLLLFIAACYFTALTVVMWRTAAMYGGELALDAQGIIPIVVLMALLFWIGAVLAVALRLRALRLEDGKPKS